MAIARCAAWVELEGRTICSSAAGKARTLFRNNGNGTFTDRTETSAWRTHVNSALSFRTSTKMVADVVFNNGTRNRYC